MSCKYVGGSASGQPEFDWKAYVLEEVPREELASYQQHASQCEDCSMELASLRLTRDALLTVRDEEVPRRIAFVSDKVFEPTWWQKLWASGPKVGFAAAAMLAAAITVHGFATRHGSVGPVQVQAVNAVDAAMIDKIVAERVEKVVAQIETRQAQKTAEILEAAQKRYSEERKADLINASANYDMVLKQVASFYKNENRMVVGQ